MGDAGGEPHSRAETEGQNGLGPRRTRAGERQSRSQGQPAGRALPGSRPCHHSPGPPFASLLPPAKHIGGH